MFISLPVPGMSAPQKPRRSPLTPPSVTPPAVSVTGSSTVQSERDRCKSPTARASTLLRSVAVVGSSSTPTSPRLYPTTPGSSPSSSPASTPPGEGCHFPFNPSQKGLQESPEGGYISFPVFEEFSGDYKSDDEGQPPHKR